jgi:hypothetical protein
MIHSAWRVRLRRVIESAVVATATLPWAAGCGGSVGSAPTGGSGDAAADAATQSPSNRTGLSAADASVIAPDASVIAPDASVIAPDASVVVAEDANISTPATDGGPFCATPLDGDAAVTTLDDVPWSAWCTAAIGGITMWTCGGVTAIVFGDGGDCNRMYLFDAVSRQLVAVMQGCNGSEACVAGNPSFQPPTACWDGSGTLPIQLTLDVCAEAGLPVSADGAGASCTSDSVCPTGFVCGYFINGGGASSGTCVYGDFANDPVCTTRTVCATDGTLTQECVFSGGGGFALKPVSTRGPTDASCASP